MTEKDNVDEAEGKELVSRLDSLEGDLGILEMKQNVVDENALRQIGQMKDTVRELRRTLMMVLERCAERKHFSELIDALNKNNAGLIDAIVKSSLSKDGAPPFEAPKTVLDEGEYLKEQLAVGRIGTESAGAAFDDAPAPQEPSGLQALGGALTKLKASRKSP